MSKELIWMWQSQPIALNECNEGQLYVIKNVLIKNSKKIWFDIEKDIWLKQVNRLIKKNSRHNYDVTSNMIIQRRLQRLLAPAGKIADILVDNLILKAFNKNKYEEKSANNK